MNIFKQLFGSAETVDLGSIIKEGAYLVDVRTAGEFAGGHVKGSVNIPLDRVNSLYFVRVVPGPARQKRYFNKMDLQTL
jgi:3-mercaptopyruvate sulfurtransferase SseA